VSTIKLKVIRDFGVDSLLLNQSDWQIAGNWARVGKSKIGYQKTMNDEIPMYPKCLSLRIADAFRGTNMQRGSLMSCPGQTTMTFAAVGNPGNCKPFHEESLLSF